MNATRPEAKTEYSTAPAADSGGRAGARAAVGVILTGLAGCVAGALLPAQRTFTISGRPTLVHSVTAASHDGWTVVMLAGVALILAVAARSSPRPRAAFAGALALGLCALFIAVVVDRFGIGRTGAVRVDGRLADAEVRAGAGLYVEAVAAVLVSLGGLTGALLGDAGRGRDSGASRPRSPRRNRDTTHAQQTPE